MNGSLPPIRRPPRYGCFLWWPVPGEDWIHEDDRFIAAHLIPGSRVFEARDGADGWIEYAYGRLTFRARPVMWTEVPQPEFRLGDWVEIRTDFGRNAPMVANVREVFWDRARRCCRYQLSLAGRRQVRLFGAEEMRLSARIGEQKDRTRICGTLREGGYLFHLAEGSGDGAELTLAPAPPAAGPGQ